MGKKVIEPHNIHLDAFWSEEIPKVEKMIRKLDAESLKKLYGMTINITDQPLFPHPKTGEPMVGDTRYFHEKPYLIILGSKPTPRILYHEVAHAIGIEDETEAMDFAIKKEREFYGNPKWVNPNLGNLSNPISPEKTGNILAFMGLIGLPLLIGFIIWRSRRE